MMIGFLIRKSFYDLWDNMLRLVLLNMGFIASLAIPVFLPRLIPLAPLKTALFFIGILWCFVYLSAIALSVKSISDYGAFGFADFFANLKAGWLAGILTAVICIVLLTMVFFIIPFYLNMKSVIGLFLGAAVFWVAVMIVFSVQYFLAIRARLDTRPLKIFKKCFIIFFDNSLFSVFILLYTLVSLVISLIFVLIIPGPAGILLFIDEALRLRLLKYDWLEANPPSIDTPKRRSIPWDAILIEEREKTGTRSFRNFIFPWKD
jgi:hypothetical protein